MTYSSNTFVFSRQHSLWIALLSMTAKKKSLEMTLRYNNVRTERLRMLLLKRYPVWGKENCPLAAWGSFNNYVVRWGGRGLKNVCFCPRSGYKNCPRRGGGVKKWQNSVHVVVECPPSSLRLQFGETIFEFAFLFLFTCVIICTFKFRIMNIFIKNENKFYATW